MFGQSTQQCVSIRSYRKESPTLTCYYVMFRSVQSSDLTNEAPVGIRIINKTD